MYQKNFFRKKRIKRIVSSRKISIFANLFGGEGAAKNDRKRSFTSCRYNSVGRVADL